MSVNLPKAHELAILLERGMTIQDIATEILSWDGLKSARITAGATPKEWAIKVKVNHPDYLGLLYQLAEELYDAGIKIYWTLPRFYWVSDSIDGQDSVIMVQTSEDIAQCIENHRNAGCRFEHIDRLHINEPWQKIWGFKDFDEVRGFWAQYDITLGEIGLPILSVDYRYPDWQKELYRHDHHIYYRPYKPMVAVRNLMAAQHDQSEDLKPIISEVGYWPTPPGETVSAKAIWTEEGIEITKELVEITKRITGELCLHLPGPWNCLKHEAAKPFLEGLREKT